MRWIGLDPGLARCGLAVSDPQGILASPVAVLEVEPRATLAQRIALVLEKHCDPLAAGNYGGIVCGLALDERGREGEAARRGRELAESILSGLQALLDSASAESAQAGRAAEKPPDLKLLFIDERFSTAVSSQQRKAAGIKAARRQAEPSAPMSPAGILRPHLTQPYGFGKADVDLPRRATRPVARSMSAAPATPRHSSPGRHGRQAQRPRLRRRDRASRQ